MKFVAVEVTYKAGSNGLNPDESTDTHAFPVRVEKGDIVFMEPMPSEVKSFTLLNEYGLMTEKEANKLVEKLVNL